MVDVEGRCFRLTNTKTGAQMRPCGTKALEFLENLPNKYTSEWVFPAIGNETHIVNIRKPMDAMCKEAGISDVTPTHYGIAMPPWRTSLGIAS